MNIWGRKLLIAVFDVFIITFSTLMALYIQFYGNIPQVHIKHFLSSFITVTAVRILIFDLFRLYKSLWEYASINEAGRIFAAVSISELAVIFLASLLKINFPRSTYAIEWMIILLALSFYRFSYRILRRLRRRSVECSSQKKRVMVIGAGKAGSMLIQEIKDHSELVTEPVAIIDDDRRKLGSYINGVPVKGDRQKILKLAEEMNIDEIIVAIPSMPKANLSLILNICKKTKCKLKILPGVYEIINGKVSINTIRDVSVEDLLGREEVNLNTEQIAGYLKNEVVLVTGGGGSIGSELCRQIAGFNPQKLLIFDIYENNAYDLQNELKHLYKDRINIEVLIGSVRDKERLEQIFSRYRPGVVFHAAAHKHVPLMEENPAEAVKNNVLGTLNVAQCADKYNTRKFALISTDKAVNPVNIMGATKRLAEMIVQSINRQSSCDFVAVRFGNVLGSNGSVIPLFKRQIALGGPVTVTHPDVLRYFMTIPEAARLVIQAGAMARGGEIFVLNMGQPVKILELAIDLIKLSGLEPEKDIKIEFTGLRPGEKLYEELLMSEEGLQKTIHEKIFIGKPLDMIFNEVLICIKALENSMDDSNALRECMHRVVPTYMYEELPLSVQN